MTYRKFRRLILLPWCVVGATVLILVAIYTGGASTTYLVVFFVLMGLHFVMLAVNYLARKRLPE